VVAYRLAEKKTKTILSLFVIEIFKDQNITHVSVLILQQIIMNAQYVLPGFGMNLFTVGRFSVPDC
jgi:hypothetical protein